LTPAPDFFAFPAFFGPATSSSIGMPARFGELPQTALRPVRSVEVPATIRPAISLTPFARWFMKAEPKHRALELAGGPDYHRRHS
jgi:hypothetical protein